MELKNLPFEQPMILRINNQYIEITVFKTSEEGNLCESKVEKRSGAEISNAG